jgi:hypothetical protein
METRTGSVTTMRQMSPLLICWSGTSKAVEKDKSSGMHARNRITRCASQSRMLFLDSGELTGAIRHPVRLLLRISLRRAPLANLDAFHARTISGASFPDSVPSHSSSIYIYWSKVCVIDEVWRIKRFLQRVKNASVKSDTGPGVS